MKLPTVTLYTRTGCHLCEAVHQVIEQVQRRRGFALITRNILDDPKEFERYQHAIPVVTLDGREIARYRMTAADLDRALDAGKE